MRCDMGALMNERRFDGQKCRYMYEIMIESNNRSSRRIDLTE